MDILKNRSGGFREHLIAKSLILYIGVGTGAAGGRGPPKINQLNEHYVPAMLTFHCERIG